MLRSTDGTTFNIRVEHHDSVFMEMKMLMEVDILTVMMIINML